VDFLTFAAAFLGIDALVFFARSKLRR
jgi:hypothetical protein